MGGYQREANETRAGLIKIIVWSLVPTKQIYVSQVDAAGPVRNGGLEAANYGRL